MTEKTVLGLTEEVTIIGDKQKKTVTARIDTGAQISSIDAELAAELKLGPIEKIKVIKSANGKKVRPVVNVNIILGGRKFNAEFTVADRKHMKYPLLIGQNILINDYIIDPQK